MGARELLKSNIYNSLFSTFFVTFRSISWLITVNGGRIEYGPSKWAIWWYKSRKIWHFELYNGKKHEKTQNFRYQYFKVKFDPVPTPTHPIFFSFFESKFHRLSFELYKKYELLGTFCVQAFLCRRSKSSFFRKNCNMTPWKKNIHILLLQNDYL